MLVRTRSVTTFSLGFMTGLFLGVGLTLLLAPYPVGSRDRQLGTHTSRGSRNDVPASGNNKPAPKAAAASRKGAVRVKRSRKTPEGKDR